MGVSENVGKNPRESSFSLSKMPYVRCSSPYFQTNPAIAMSQNPEKNEGPSNSRDLRMVLPLDPIILSCFSPYYHGLILLIAGMYSSNISK